MTSSEPRMNQIFSGTTEVWDLPANGAPVLVGWVNKQAGATGEEVWMLKTGWQLGNTVHFVLRSGTPYASNAILTFLRDCWDAVAPGASGMRKWVHTPVVTDYAARP